MNIFFNDKMTMNIYVITNDDITMSKGKIFQNIKKNNKSSMYFFYKTLISF